MKPAELSRLVKDEVQACIVKILSNKTKHGFRNKHLYTLCIHLRLVRKMAIPDIEEVAYIWNDHMTEYPMHKGEVREIIERSKRYQYPIPCKGKSPHTRYKEAICEKSQCTFARQKRSAAPARQFNFERMEELGRDRVYFEKLVALNKNKGKFGEPFRFTLREWAAMVGCRPQTLKQKGRDGQGKSKLEMLADLGFVEYKYEKGAHFIECKILT